MNRSTKFINDIFIYAIGNLGSKLITFLLVPLYTYYISPDDFGYYDIVLTLTFLAMGFITFQLRDGTFRFLLDNEDEYTRKGVVSFSYKLMAQSSLVVLLVGIVFSFFYDIRDWGWIVAFVITLSLYEVEVQIVRGLGQNKSFVLAGILTAFQIGLYSLIFVAWLRMGIAGIFCSNILSRLVTMVIIEFRARVFKRYFIVSFRDKSLNRALLKYSLPLLPNAVCWWLLGSSSRLFIEHFLGLEANGIFAVAMKFSTILETFSVIVYQAWQETAIKQYGAADRSKFFSRIFNTYILILSVLALIFVFVLKINYSWLVDYTYYISPDDFGYYDIVLTLTFLAMGFITFQLRDGTFRFLLDNEDEYTRKGVVSFSYKLMAQSSLVVLLVGIVFSFFYDIRDWGWIVAFVITLSLYEVEVQIVRGLGQNKSFVLAGILTAFQIGLYSLIFVAWLRMGIAGIFCSNILSRLVTMVIIEFRARVFKRYFIVSFRDKSLNRALLKYSLPLLPNAVCWWLLGSSSRLFIEHFLGLEANGIFAVAMKFSTILETFSVIVYQAWQETAIKQYGAADRSKFFSRIFNTYILILSVLALIFVFVLKINYSWLVDSRYLESLQYLYPMFISVICFALASFYDLGYQCSKQTVRNLPGVITTTGLNLIMNYVFIRFMGIWGIVLSSILSYLFMLGFRIIDTWKFFPVKVSMEIIYPILFLIGGAIVFYRVDSIILQIIYITVIVILSYCIQPRTIRQELQMKIKALFN